MGRCTGVMCEGMEVGGCTGVMCEGMEVGGVQV